MKTFKLLMLPLFFLYADSTNIEIPKDIEKKLCQKLLHKTCNSDQTLASDYYYKLDNNQTLFFFHINQKNGLFQHGYKNLSALVDSKNKWKISNNIIDAEIQEVVQDPKGGIWLRTLWMIEGVSPYLYYSKNAIDWRAVPFPKKRPSAGPFEDLQLCFLDNEIELTFGKIDHKKSERTWSAPYEEASSKHPQWKALNYSKPCPNIFIENNDSWSIESNDDGLKIVLKTDTTPLLPYTIQLGAFKQKESLDAMKKSLNNLPEKLIDKEVFMNGIKKYKLFLDSYKNYDTAKAKLEKLKRMYTKNQIIQDAYVIKLP
jgi:hypothetical protein